MNIMIFFALSVLQIFNRGVYGSSSWIVDEHNRVRAQVPAGDMENLAWSNQLQNSAQVVANRCRLSHSKTGYGENLFAKSGTSVDWAGALNSWVSERKHYRYSRCCRNSQSTGHYTQVIWADTKFVGCASAVCYSNSPVGRSPWVLQVCQYYPTGNVQGQTPY